LYIPFPESKHAAHAGGTVAGNARRELEQKSGRKVVTSENYLALTQSVKKAKALAKPAKIPKTKPCF
jgi:DNA-damage-inducible protein D